MVDCFPIIFKNQLIELLTDLLRLKTTQSHWCMIAVGKSLAEKADPDLIMSSMSEDLLKADIEKLIDNSDEMFEYVFNCLTRKQVKQEFIKNNFKDFYSTLSSNEKEIIADYLKQMKKICEVSASAKPCEKK
jgi:hypothetical protein